MANASELSCENIGSVRWSDPIGEVKTCNMYSTSIESKEMTISPKDETVKGLHVATNIRIKFLPVRISEIFPYLLGYSAHGCSLTKITKENFKSLNKMKLLWLHDNQILVINSDTFEDLTELTMLCLSKKINFLLYKTFIIFSN